MASEWIYAPLADVVEIVSGGTPKTSVPEYWDGDIPWLSVTDFNTGYRWVNRAQKAITDRGLSESATAVLDRGDIIISARGTVGVVAQLSSPMAFNQSCYGVRGKQGITDTDFIYYVLKYSVSSLKQVAYGGVFDTITRETFRLIDTPIPPLPEQRTIAYILGSLDDKIELNRRMNQTLEDIARALFKSWFVDFDPVRVNAKKLTQKALKAQEALTFAPFASLAPLALNPPIADLFPDAFVDSELGKIPKGWKVAGLDEIATLVKESVKPMQEPTKLWEHYSIPAFDASRAPVVELGESIQSGKYRVPITSVLVSKLNPQYSRIWLPDVQDEEAAICSTEFMPFVPLKDIWRPFLYELMRSDPIQQGIQERVTGSTGSRQRAKPGDVAAMRIIIPSFELIEAFSCMVRPLHEKALSCIRESLTLAALRDTLLPKLISGELRVPEVSM